MTWQDHLLHSQTLFRDALPLRHGARTASASKIGRQYYCEMKLEQEYVHGRVETAAKTAGAGLHDELILTTPVDMTELISHIETEPVCVVSMHLWAKYRGAIIGGVPDAVVFRRGKPVFVIELKTTAGILGKLWKGEVVQGKVYGLCLDLMKFDCAELRIVIIRLKRSAGLEGDEKQSLMNTIINKLMDKNMAEFRRGDRVRVYDFPYEWADTVVDINWALGYWLNEREPKATDRPERCGMCEYKAVCPASLV